MTRIFFPLVCLGLMAPLLAMAKPVPAGDCVDVPSDSPTSICKDICTYDSDTQAFTCDLALQPECDNGVVMDVGSYPNSEVVTAFGVCDQTAFCCQNVTEATTTQGTDFVFIVGTEGVDDIDLTIHDSGTDYDLTARPDGPRSAVVKGGSGRDFLDGSNWARSNYTEQLDGGDGCDVIRGHDGNDFLNTGNGDGCASPADIADGGGGDDTLVAGGSAVGGQIDLFGGDGNDTLIGGAASGGNVTLFGEADVDTLIAHPSKPTTMYGGSEGDFLFGSTGIDEIQGGGGDDHIEGGGGSDWIDGGDGDDDIIVHPSSPSSTVFAGAGADRVLGGDGDDDIDAGAGDDIVHGGAGEDEIWGRDDMDILFGGTGEDKIAGGMGRDYLCDTQLPAMPVAPVDLLIGDDASTTWVQIPDPGAFEDRAYVEMSGSPQAASGYLGANDVERIYHDPANSWPYFNVVAPVATIWPYTLGTCEDAMDLPNVLLPL